MGVRNLSAPQKEEWGSFSSGGDGSSWPGIKILSAPEKKLEEAILTGRCPLALKTDASFLEPYYLENGPGWFSEAKMETICNLNSESIETEGIAER